MKRSCAFIFLFLVAILTVQAQTGPVQSHSFLGGTAAKTQGLNSTNYLDGIIPAATITVYLHGTTTKATIFADNINTPLANPFTSNTLAHVDPGGWIFWAATGQVYDVVMSGGNANPACNLAPLCYVQPVTLVVGIGGGGGGGGGCTTTGPAGTFQASNGVGGCQPAAIDVNGTALATPSPVNFVNSTTINFSNPSAGQITAVTVDPVLFKHDGTLLTGQFQATPQIYDYDETAITPDTGDIVATFRANTGSGKWNVEVPSGQPLQMQPGALPAGQHVIIFPQQCVPTSAAGTGVATCNGKTTTQTCSPGSLACANAATTCFGGGALQPCGHQTAVFSGFALPITWSQANVTAVYPIIFSTSQGPAQTLISASTATTPSNLINSTGAVQQTFSAPNALPTFGSIPTVSSITFTLDSARTLASSFLSTSDVPMVALAVYDAVDPAVTPSSNLLVEAPLFYDPSVNGIGLSLPFDLAFDFGSTNAYQAILPGVSATSTTPPPDGLHITLVPLSTNTTSAPTLALNGGPTITIFKSPNGGATTVGLANGDITANARVQLIYDANLPGWLIPAAAPGSPNLSVQYNCSGVFCGDSFFKTDGAGNPTANSLTLGDNSSGQAGYAVWGAGTGPLSITAWSITSNVVTFTVTNTLTSGTSLFLTGFGTSTFFNGQTVTVLSAGLSSSQFEANFTHANGSATEAGNALTSNSYTFTMPSSVTGSQYIWPSSLPPGATGYVLGPTSSPATDIYQLGWVANGGGTIGGSGTTGFIPSFASSTTLGNSHIDDGVTTASTITSTEPVTVNASTLPSQIAVTYDGHAPTVGGATTAEYAADSSGNAEVSSGGAAYSLLCTQATGCPSSGSTAWSAITGGTNTSNAFLVGNSGSFGPTGTGTVSANQDVILVANASSTGTTANTLTKLTGAPSTAVIAATTDTGGIVGITISGAGTTGTATIARGGLINCVFSNATTAGDYVQISSGTGGDCADTGAATYPTSGQVIGRVLSTNGSAGTYQIDLFPAEIKAASGGGSGTNVNVNGGSTLATSTQNGLLPYKCSDTSGSATAQSCTTTPSFTPTAGNCISYNTTTANTGALTLNVDSSAADAVQKWLGTALASGDMPANKTVPLCFDGTNWQMMTIGNAPTGAFQYSALTAPPAVGGFTQTNFQGSTTATQPNGAGTPIQLTIPNTSTLQWQLITKSTPSTPWRIEMFVKSNQITSNGNAGSAGAGGIYLTNGTKLWGLEYLNFNQGTANPVTGLRLEKMNSVSSDNSTAWGYSSSTHNSFDLGNNGGQYLAFCDDGTNLFAEVSEDGIVWSSLFEDTGLTWMTPTTYGAGGLQEAVSGATEIVSLQGLVVATGVTCP